MTPRSEIEAALEAILFVSSEPIPRERLVGLFEEGSQEEVAAALQAVLDRYRPEEGRGLMAEEVAGGVRIVTRPELGGWLRRFYDIKASGKLSMPALETLAIVAYRQPITAPEVQELRGVSSAGVLKTLLERRLIRIAGRKPVVGNPFLYRTTKEFLVQFGLQAIKELPPLEEFEETFGESGEGSGAAGPPEGTAGGELEMEGDREEGILRAVAALDERSEGDEGEERGEQEPTTGAFSAEGVEPDGEILEGEEDAARAAE